MAVAVGVVVTTAACATIVGHGHRMRSTIDVYRGERISTVISYGEKENLVDGKVARSVISRYEGEIFARCDCFKLRGLRYRRGRVQFECRSKQLQDNRNRNRRMIMMRTPGM